MLLSIGDWKFDIDLEASMAYSAQEAASHCDCAYCRNFYASVDAEYPGLRPFLARFGLDIEAPEELMPFDDGIYELSYAVSGRILQQGTALEINGISVYPQTQSEVNTDCPAPYFFLELGLFSLPWVLDEPFDQVISTANAPGFLERMWRKLLGRADDTQKQ